MTLLFFCERKRGNILIDDYKSNSFKSKANAEKENKQLEKIVKGNVKTKKRSDIKKFADKFIGIDGKSLKEYVISDFLIPTIKKGISEIVDICLYPNGKNSSKVSYRGYYEKDRHTSIKRRIGYEYDDIVLDDRREAEEVLSRMEDLIATYGIASVADLYELVGVSCNYTDNKYGWTDIRSASVVRTREGGYLIKLPKALPLD